jgi:hypothetical protein
MIAGPAAAASGKGGTTSSTTGNDISWPQCGRAFPTGQSFGIVGVNGGLANNLNPCLGELTAGKRSTSELVWASGSSGSTKVPSVALYVNTADPGSAVADWPTTNIDPTGTNTDPTDGTTIDLYGACTGADSTACAWQYGWNRAVQDMVWLRAAATQVGVANAASAYRWWLDVETGNSWETGATGLAKNVADLEGMVAAFSSAGASAGVYSTSYQWGVITGGPTSSPLVLLPDWIPGARTASGAATNCSLKGFTGQVLMTQWFGAKFDGDVGC